MLVGYQDKPCKKHPVQRSRVISCITFIGQASSGRVDGIRNCQAQIGQERNPSPQRSRDCARGRV